MGFLIGAAIVILLLAVARPSLRFRRTPEHTTLDIEASAQLPRRPDYKRKRAAPSSTPRPGTAPPRLADDIAWTRIVTPRERYRILYLDKDGERSERVVELQKLGDVKGVPYLGVVHQGKFKTLRADRVLEVREQLTAGHEPSIRAWQQIGYGDTLPPFPVEQAVYRVPSIAGNRHWTVDLNAYTCTCPEKRIRAEFGYKPGQVGMVCPHMARATVEQLPAVHSGGWSEELLTFLKDPRKVHIDNLL